MNGVLRMALPPPAVPVAANSSCNAMAGALATRLFGAEERRAARLRRTRRQTRMFEAQPSLRVCLDV